MYLTRGAAVQFNGRTFSHEHCFLEETLFPVVQLFFSNSQILKTIDNDTTNSMNTESHFH